MSVYNAEKYLEKAVYSILNQTFTNFELIIIEDASTDSSLKILQSLEKKDKRIKILKKQINKGTEGFIENLNWGLQEAKGKYIARMDADDISHPERFQKQFDYLEKNPDIFIVGGQLNFINEQDKIIGEKHASLTDETIKKKMPKTIQLFHPLIMFRNSDLRYRTKSWYCEDYDFYLQLMTGNKKMANLPEKLLQYRILNTSISRKDNHLTRKLFLEKIILFYQERLSYGKDSYDDFAPNDFIEIKNINYPSRVSDLKFGMRVCLKYNLKNSYRLIFRKLRTQYPKENLIINKMLDFSPNIIFTIISTIIANFK